MLYYLCALVQEGALTRTEGSMKIIKVAALIALASLPFLLLKRRPAPVPQVVESENIFDDDLAA